MVLEQEVEIKHFITLPRVAHAPRPKTDHVVILEAIKEALALPLRYSLLIISHHISHFWSFLIIMLLFIISDHIMSYLITSYHLDSLLNKGNWRDISGSCLVFIFDHISHFWSFMIKIISLFYHFWSYFSLIIWYHIMLPRDWLCHLVMWLYEVLSISTSLFFMYFMEIKN